ncbi:hypothetical protein GCM10008107_20580 [Psychrosphaera saromensis]|uniref:Uncharacterized protein n=1 Tax=Psychrosphaera saromensis TaxID=716813 RepID=A0A2S7USN9_9GAMM|nr:DUF6404 family protein [Psychrosphaera saromensis]PQJ52755.1 hypothetical protein BTO11_03175 [Psychrosphaera saromensis]GHB70977.1 hypothetical protein GCM10008107_20580 [Psychrosphaera saromensis]GLQ13244.1 hypothetical protein GCM10007917_06990 [Psychrosphaera saromensis]
MSYQSKLEKAQAELAQTDMREANYNPPIFVLLRKLGLKIRPVHYNTFIKNFAFLATFFGLIWGLLMWFTTWSTERLPIFNVVGTSIFSGLLFGLIMSLYYRKSAAKHKLSKWEDL